MLLCKKLIDAELLTLTTRRSVITPLRSAQTADCTALTVFLVAMVAG